MLVDSHCHLDYFNEPERSEIVGRARAAGVAEMVTIGTRLSASESLRRIANDQNVWATVGVHPHNAGESWNESGEGPSPESIAAETEYPRVVGIGESGLDYFYDKSPRPAQQAGFRAHIRAARLASVPLVIHAREADADVAEILRDEWDRGGAFTFLLHCFSSGRGLAEAALALGGYISFSGILTFPRSEELRAIARDVPAERILVETDSPYLAPVPLRGKRCEPAYVVHTAAKLAEVRGLSPAALAELTTANFRRLFTRAA
jgi:TatD DNase family protein